MTKKVIGRNIKLSLEFDKYIASHPDTLRKVPRGVCIVPTVKGDKIFNRTSFSTAHSIKGKWQKCIEVRKEGKQWVVYPHKSRPTK